MSSLTSALYTSSLTKYLFDDSTDLSDVLAKVKQETSFLTKDSTTGKLSLPSLKQMTSATTDSDKLTAANKLAQSIKVYANAAAQTGATNRLSSMVDEAAQVMDGLSDAVSGLNDEGAVSTNKTTIASTLTSLRSSMVQMSRLSKKLSTADADTIKQKLTTMDTKAQGIAKMAGLSYTSIFGSSGTTTTSATTAVSSAVSTNLVDYLV